MNKLLLLLLAVALAPATVNRCHGQDWRDPAFQQPLPQYYPASRYPLNEPEDFEEIAPLEALTPQIPENNSPPLNAQNTAPQSIFNADSDINQRPIQNSLTEQPIVKRSPKREVVKKKQPASSVDKTAKNSHPVISYDIYRDGSKFPIDPRKPCSVCRRPISKCNCGADHGQCGPGNQGQPYQDREPGGYACGKNCPDKRPMFSVYWPRPFSAKRADGHPHRCNCDLCATRINDRFDHLFNFKLIDYQRTDNGYCGPGADPYGCLGESKYQDLGF